MRNIIKEQSILKKLKLQLSVAYFLLGAVLASGVFVFWPQINGIAQALTGTYNKITGDQLTIADWNNLDNDFVAKSGDTMGGDLNMGGHTVTNLPNPTNSTDATNLASVNSAITAAIGAMPSPSIRNVSGATLKMVCGNTNPSAWQTYIDGRTVYVDVDTTVAGFSSNPFILSTLGGSGWHWKTYGATSIYDLTPTSFRVYVYNINSTMNAADALSWGWSLNWCAIGS